MQIISTGIDWGHYRLCTGPESKIGKERKLVRNKARNREEGIKQKELEEGMSEGISRSYM